MSCAPPFKILDPPLLPPYSNSYHSLQLPLYDKTFAVGIDNKPSQETFMQFLLIRMPIASIDYVVKHSCVVE